MDRITIIQLCRFGDIVSILPIAKHLSKDNEVTIICHEDFAGILDACSYVKVQTLSTHHRDIISAVAKAKLEGFDQILVTQLAGNTTSAPYQTENFQQNQWARAGYPEKFHDLPLIFDKRNKEFEDKAINLHLPKEDGRPLLGYSLHSISSIYLRWKEQEEWIKETFGKTHRLMNFGDICVGQVHNLIGLIEKCDKLITVDTLHLHLAYATMTPTIALTQDDPQKRSEPRKHWIEHINYTESLEDIGRERIINAVYDKAKLGRFVRSIFVPKSELEDDNRIAIIELARYGDIVNVLPIAYDLHKKGNEVHWFVHPNFADILEAVSYVKVHKYGGSDRDVSGAADYAIKLGFKRVLELQVNGNKLPSPIECENFITQSWARANYLDKFHELPLIFDRREIDEEWIAVNKTISNKKTITYCLESHSSPMPNKEKFEAWIIKEFGEKYNLVNIGSLKFKKSHHLLGIIGSSDLLISIDTLPLHLSYATNIPTIALAPDHNTQGYKERYKWYQSEPRNNWIERVTYTEALEKSGQDKIIKAVNEKREFGKFCRSFENFKLDRIVHAVEWHIPPQQDERRRLLSAHKTWESARNSDNSYKIVIVDTDKAKRTSKTELGDNRSLPFLYDIINAGVNAAEKNDILLLTNSDICLTPEVPTIVRAKLAKYPCCFSRRIDVQNADQPKSLRMIAGIEPHPGTDLFAFRLSWWEKRKNDFPDLLAACEGWDFVFRHIMLWDNPKAQIEPPIIYHELHRAYWYRGDVIKSNPGQLYNRKLCREWAIKYGYDDALNLESANGLFKLDGTFSRQTPKKN